MPLLILYIYLFICTFGYGMGRKQALPSDCHSQNVHKRVRMVQGQEAVIRDLFAHINNARLKQGDFNYEHCDLPFINSVVQVAKNYVDAGIEDVTGYLIIEYAFKRNIYYSLAEFLGRQNILSVRNRLYNPNMLLEAALYQNDNLANADLALRLGASPHVVLLYPMVRHNCIEHVYMCGVSKYARESDISRLRLLIRNNARLNIHNKEENPLYCALASEIRFWTRDLVNILLYYGADPKLRFSHDERGIRGETPLECARERMRLNFPDTLYIALYRILYYGHERRVRRMGDYLFRVINGNGTKRLRGHGDTGRFIPRDLCYHIAEMHYGKLKEQSIFNDLRSHSAVHFRRKGDTRPPLPDRLPREGLNKYLF